MSSLKNIAILAFLSVGLCTQDVGAQNSLLSSFEGMPSSANFQKQRGGQGQGQGRPPRGGADTQRQQGQRGQQGQAQRGGQGQRGQQGQQNGGQQQGMDAATVAQRMMDNFDADGDGSLNLTELTNGLTALEQHMRQQRGQGQSQRGQNQGQQGRQGGFAQQGQGSNQTQQGRRPSRMRPGSGNGDGSATRGQSNGRRSQGRGGRN